MPQLQVLRIADRDVYKDIVRVSDAHRFDNKGSLIEEGTICWVQGTPRRSVVTMRGFQRSTDPAIRMDDRTRNRLHVQSGHYYDFEFKRAGMWGQFKWAWTASDTGYKISSRLALIGLFLGLLAFIPVLSDWVRSAWECVKPILNRGG